MKPLDSIGKRDLLAAERYKEAVVREYAEDYLEQGLYGDAFEFFRKLADEDGVNRVKRAVIGDADPEVLWRIEKAFPHTVTPDDWVQCGEAATKAGKFRCAAYAFEHINDSERLAAATKEFTPAEEAPPDAQTPSPG